MEEKKKLKKYVRTRDNIIKSKLLRKSKVRDAYYRKDNLEMVYIKDIVDEADDIRELIKLHDVVRLNNGDVRVIKNEDFTEGGKVSAIITKRVTILYIWDKIGNYRRVAQSNGSKLEVVENY